jgi:hypothetical protein
MKKYTCYTVAELMEVLSKFDKTDRVYVDVYEKLTVCKLTPKYKELAIVDCRLEKEE